MAPSKQKDLSSLSGMEKASILMMSLDEEVASKVFAMMTEEEIKGISQTMSSLGKVDQTQIETLITEFTEEITSGKTIIGDISSAKKLLTKALGAEKVESIMADMGGPSGKDTWDKLNSVDEDLLAAFLKNEHPQTVALILTKMGPSNSAKILSRMPDEFAINIITRMINIEPVKREILSDIEMILQNEFMSSLAQTKKVNSFEMVAEIFNNFDRQAEQKFFEMLDNRNPDISTQIRDLMFTFDDIIKIPAAGIQAILRVVDKQKLPIALKGANDAIKELFFSNMSERASKILKEDMASLGPVRISDVDEAQTSVVQTARALADSGEIIIPEANAEQEQLIY